MANSTQRPPAQTDAERARAYRQRKQQHGLKALKVDLGPVEMAYLKALYDIHDITLSEAVGLALTRAFRGS